MVGFYVCFIAVVWNVSHSLLDYPFAFLLFWVLCYVSSVSVFPDNYSVTLLEHIFQFLTEKGYMAGKLADTFHNTMLFESLTLIMILTF